MHINAAIALFAVAQLSSLSYGFEAKFFSATDSDGDSDCSSNDSVKSNLGERSSLLISTIQTHNRGVSGSDCDADATRDCGIIIRSEYTEESSVEDDASEQDVAAICELSAKELALLQERNNNVQHIGDAVTKGNALTECIEKEEEALVVKGYQFEKPTFLGPAQPILREIPRFGALRNILGFILAITTSIGHWLFDGFGEDLERFFISGGELGAIREDLANYMVIICYLLSIFIFIRLNAEYRIESIELNPMWMDALCTIKDELLGVCEYANTAVSYTRSRMRDPEMIMVSQHSKSLTEFSNGFRNGSVAKCAPIKQAMVDLVKSCTESNLDSLIKLCTLEPNPPFIVIIQVLYFMATYHTLANSKPEALERFLHSCMWWKALPTWKLPYLFELSKYPSRSILAKFTSGPDIDARDFLGDQKMETFKDPLLADELAVRQGYIRETCNEDYYNVQKLLRLEIECFRRIKCTPYFNISYGLLGIFQTCTSVGGKLYHLLIKENDKAATDATASDCDQAPAKASPHETSIQKLADCNDIIHANLEYKAYWITDNVTFNFSQK